MQIKEAAALCGLTEKAIRLYEEKGLITPHYTEINGRKFRDYDEETIKQLKTIAGLRQSFFSLEQIAAMQKTPENIPDIFSGYRDELRRKFSELETLVSRADEIDPASLTTAARLSEAMTGISVSAGAEVPTLTPGTAQSLSDDEAASKQRKVPTHTVPEVRFRVWDEEIGRDARDAAYRRYLAYEKQWERSYDRELFWDRIVHFYLYPVGRWVIAPVLCLALLFAALYFLGWKSEVDLTYAGYEVIFAEEIWDSNEAIFAALPEGVVPHEADIGSFPKAVETKPTTLRLRGHIVRYLFRQDYFEGQILADGFYTYDAFYRKRMENNSYRISLPDGILGTMGPYFFPERKTDDTSLIAFYSWGTLGSGEEQIIIPIETDTDSGPGETAYLVFGAESADAASDMVWDRYWREIQYQAWEADSAYYQQKTE